MFNVLNTIYPTVVPEMIYGARELRNGLAVAKDKKEVIEID
jgi:hypothetical protein